MNNKVHLLRDARIDLRKAFEWYEFQEPGLGDRLLLSVRSSLEKCSDNPLGYPVFATPFRRMRVETFPYLVFYSIESDKILIYAIFHTSRDPEVLKYRLRKGSL